MGFSLNPLSGFFDITGSAGGYIGYKSPVATEPDLPLVGNSAGDARVTLDTEYLWVWDDTTSRWINIGVKVANAGSVPNSSGYSLQYVDVGSNRRELQLVLQPANGTNPGILSTGTQSIAGAKTLTNTTGSSDKDTGALIVEGGLGVEQNINAGGTVLGSNLSGTNTGDISLAAVGATPNANGASLTGQVLNLQPADGSNPGVLTTSAQTIAGNKTFSGIVLANGGVDVTATGGTDTLAIGTGNADVINIGNSNTVINFVGTTNNVTVTDLNVTDKNITINDGGAVGSGSNSGISIEENALITGYVETSGDRNSWTLKAPNQAGIVTVSPGASGFTLDQGSHDPVTIGTANGLSLNVQEVSLDLSSSSTTGALSDTDWITFNSKQDAGDYITNLTGDVVADGPGSVSSTIQANVVSDGKLRQSAGLSVIGRSANTTGNVADITAGANGDVLHRSGAIVHFGAISNNSIATGANIARTKLAGATADTVVVNNASGDLAPVTLTDGQLLIGATGAAPLAASLATGTGLSTSVGANSIQINLSIPPSSGDLSEASASILNNQTSFTNLTGLLFPTATVRSFKAEVSVFVSGTTDTFEKFTLEGINKGSVWNLIQSSVGDNSQIIFDIATSGQVQYKSPAYAGFTVGTARYRAITTSV